MEDSIAYSFEISVLTRKIWKACLAAKTRKFQSLVLHNRCSQIDGYVLGWKTGSLREEFVYRAGGVMADMLGCFRRAFNLVRECSYDDWKQRALVRQHGELEFRRIVEDMEMGVEVLIHQVLGGMELMLQKVLEDRCFVREELRDAARKDRDELMHHLGRSSSPAADALSRHLQQRLSNPAADALSRHLLQRLQDWDNEAPPLNKGQIQPLRIDFNEVKWHGIPLGTGASGTVYRGEWLNHPVAVKVFKHDDVTFEKEVAAMSKLVKPHPHVLQMIGYSQDPGNEQQLIIMELMKMDLRKYLDRRGNTISVLAAVDIMLQIARGTRHLHNHSVVHRDLKPQNVLVDFNDDHDGQSPGRAGAGAGGVNVRLNDFGIARTDFDTLVNDTLTHLRGTPRYMAPEMMVAAHEPRYSRKVDVYSFAVICSEILTGCPPFGSDRLSIERLKSFLAAGRRPDLPEACPDELADLIRRCWSGDPNLRPGFDDIERELVKVKKQLLVPGQPVALSQSSCSSGSTSTSSSTPALTSARAMNMVSLPGVELRTRGAVEVGGKISVLIKPVNATRYAICRWIRKSRNVSGETAGTGPETESPTFERLKTLLVEIPEGAAGIIEFRELSYAITAADFDKKLVLECLPLNLEFRCGLLVEKSTGTVSYGRTLNEIIHKSWRNGQACFKVVHLHPKWWESTGKLFINRNDYYLWWGQGNPSNLRFVFSEAGANETVPIQLDGGHDSVLCKLRKTDGSFCTIKFTSSASRDTAVLTMKFFWDRRERSG